MFWADKIAKNIINSGQYKPYWVDDMKTPSGRIHVGSLRGVVVHDLIYQALISAGQKADYTYVFDNHDPMDALPVYLDRKTWSQYLGQPLFTIPSPDKKAKNYAQYFAQEFIDVFTSIGSHPQILWANEFYLSGKMNDSIALILDHAASIRNIYAEVYKKKIPDDWYPFSVVCPKCGKESTTKVNGWDGKMVSFVCQTDAVEWTRGCGYSGKASPFSGEGKFAGKLPWKVEWAVKWKVIGVTIEGAGKDHMTAGGSHVIAARVAEEVLRYPVPYPFSYEFFLYGGKKMSSSKGLGSSAKDIADLLPPNLVRFLFARTDYRQAIEFDPMGTMAIPDLFDEYDRSWQAYNTDSDENLARVFEMSQIDKPPKKNAHLFLPRFRDMANYKQLPNVDLWKKLEEMKKGRLTEEEMKIFKEREKYVSIWLGKYAPKDQQMVMSESLPKEAEKLTKEQKIYLAKLIPLVTKDLDPDQLQFELYELAKKTGLRSLEAFSAIYLSFIGKERGPRAAWFLLQYPKETVIKRLTEASS